MTEAISENHAVATALAASGFAVFPCHSGGKEVKRPMPGVFWRSASSSDRAEIDKWWQKWPDAAVGLDLAKSRLVVIDADRHDADADGVTAIADLMGQNSFDPNDVPVVATPNQGTHFYFRQPDGADLGNGRGALPPGIDVRGSGGYVIAPGSKMQDGRLYEVFGEVADAPILPDWLAQIIAAPKKQAPLAAPVPVNVHHHSDERIRAYCDAAINAETEAVRSAPAGTRNNQLNTSSFAIGQLVGAGWLSETDANGVLENAAFDLAKDDGLPSVRKTIRSGLRAGMREPRQLPDNQVSDVDGQISARNILQSASGEIIDPETGEILVAGQGKEIGANANVTGTLEGAGNAEEISQIGGAEHYDLPDALLDPGGLVGELADWICEWTAQPVRIHAIGAALTIVGALAARKVYTRSRPTCTALYIGAIAPSGMGKQHPQDCVRLVLDTVTGHGRHHMGWNVSLPAIAVALNEQAAKVMVVDEFADKLASLRSRNATTSQSAISEGLRSLWGTNTATFAPDVSLNRGDIKIMRPALSLFGASTVKDFTRSLVSRDVTNGLLNRFLIFPRFEPVEQGEECDGIITLPERLHQRCSWLYECLDPIQMAQSVRGDGYPEPILVPFTDAAEAMNEANKARQTAMMAESDEDDALALYGRFAEQIKRVALIVACGRCCEDLKHARIEASDMEFAGRLVTWSVEQFVTMVRRDMVENWVQEQHNLVLGIIRKAKKIPRSALYRRVKGRMRGRDLDEVIKSLMEGGNVQAMDVETGGRGRPSREYWYVRD